MENKKTSHEKGACCTSNSCSSNEAQGKSSKTEVEQNLHDIKQALEKILHATSIEQVAKVSSQEQADMNKIANVAKLHSHAAEAYAQLLDILSKRN